MAQTIDFLGMKVVANRALLAQEPPSRARNDGTPGRLQDREVSLSPRDLTQAMVFSISGDLNMRDPMTMI